MEREDLKHAPVFLDTSPMGAANQIVLPADGAVRPGEPADNGFPALCHRGPLKSNAHIQDVRPAMSVAGAASIISSSANYFCLAITISFTFSYVAAGTTPRETSWLLLA